MCYEAYKCFYWKTKQTNISTSDSEDMTIDRFFFFSTAHIGQAPP